jgi:RecA/RadA recombinase
MAQKQKRPNKPSLTVVEDKSDIQRYKTWFSLDKATGGGYPLFTFDEWSGFPMTGKSSVCTALAGMVNPKGTVLVTPFENYSTEYIQRGLQAVGFQGKLIIVSNKKAGKPRRPEDMLDEMCDSLADETISAVIWDSIGATPTTPILEGSVGDANMGKPATMVKFTIMKCNWLMSGRTSPVKTFATNHCHPNFGTQGYSTSGGMAVRYNTGVRVRLSRMSDDLRNECFFVQGRIDRLKFVNMDESEENNFWFAVSPKTHGFHPGLTALLDCEKFGLVERENGTIKHGNKSYGRLNAMCEKADDDSVFAPFFELLKEVK